MKPQTQELSPELCTVGADQVEGYSDSFEGGIEVDTGALLYTSVVKVSAQMREIGEAGDSMSQPASLLDGVRDALRGKKTRTSATAGVYEEGELKPVTAALEAYCRQHQDKEVRAVRKEQFQPFVQAMGRYEKLLENETEFGDTDRVFAGILYIQEALTIQEFGVADAFKMARYHSPSAVRALQEVCDAHPAIFRPADAKHILKEVVGDPMKVVRSRIARYQDLTENILPRLCQQYAYDGQWPDSYIKKIVATFEEVEAPARAWFVDRAMVAEAYPDVQPEEIDSMLFETKTRQRVLERVNREPVILDPDGPALQGGEETLNTIRSLRREHWPSGKRVADEAELARQLLANAWIYEGMDADVHEIARYITTGIKGYYDALGSAPSEPEDLLAISAAYIADIKAISGHTTPAIATILAKSLSYEQYLSLMHTYGTATGLAMHRLHDLMVRTPTDPEKRLRMAVDCVRGLSDRFGDELEPDDIAKIVGHTNATPEKAVSVAEAYLKQFNETYSALSQEYRWLDEQTAKNIFLSSYKPAEELTAMVADVSRILQASPKELYLTSIGLLNLLSRNRSLDADSAVKKYVMRLGELRATCRDKGLSVPVSYLASWAVKSPKGDVVGNFVATCDAFKSYLAENGEVVDDTVLGELAFKWPSEASVRQHGEIYLNIRRQLMKDAEFNPYITTQMIDMAAVVNSVSYARVRLFFMNAARSRMDSGHSVVDSGTADPKNRVPEATYSFDDLMQAIDERLTPKEADAVRGIFGIIDVDEASMAEALGVEDLEGYVRTVLLPKVRQGIAWGVA